MNRLSLPAIGGLALAIAITATMDATGYAMFSALPLMPLAGLFWFLQKFSRQDVGLTRGDAGAYTAALAYPVLALGLIAAVAFAFGATDSSNTDWQKALLNMLLMSTTGVVMGLITEEGFFRG